MIGSGIGEFPIGGFPLSDSVSVSDPLPGLLADPSQPREFLLRASNGIDLSSGGYTSAAFDIPYKLFPGAIGRPYNFSVELPTPDLKGGSTLGIGELRVNNPDGLRDSDALADWLGQDADVHIGQKNQVLSSFTRFFRGKSAGVSWDLNSYSILHRDLRFKLQKKLQQNRYKGFGSAVRFDQINDMGSSAITCPVGSMTMEVETRPLSTSSIGCVVNWVSGVSPGLRQIYRGGDTWNFVVRNDVGTAFQAISSMGSVIPGRLQHVVGVLDLVAAKIFLYVWIDNTIVEVVSVPITGTFNSALSTFYVGANDTAGFLYNGDIDEVRVWSAPLSLDQLKSSKDRQLAGTESSLYSYWKMDEGSGSIAANSVSGKPSVTLSGSPAWVGSLEGDTSLAGLPKPVLLGFKRHITPRLVDPQRLVYQWHDGTGAGCDAVYDGGDAYTPASDVSDIYSVTPALGTFTTSNVNGLFRLGSAPIGVITCTCRGDNSGSGYVNNTSDVHQRLAVKYGGLSSSDLNLDTYALLKAKAPHVVGFYYSEDINVDIAMDDCMKMGTNGWWSPDRVAKVSVGRIDDPSTMTPDISITRDDIVDPAEGGVFQSNPIGVRVGRVILGYRRYGTTLTDDQVSGVLSLSVRKDLGEEYRYVTATDPNRHPDSDTMTVYTEIDDPVVAQAEADRLLDLWKVDRRVLRLSLDQGVLSYFIGTAFLVQVSRYDLTIGKKYVTFGVIEDMGQYGQPDRLEVLLFGAGGGSGDESEFIESGFIDPDFI